MISATKLKNRLAPDYQVHLKNICINGEKRGCSGFVQKGDVFVYVNTEPHASLGYLYRTAAHSRDYVGGHNMWARDLESLVAGIRCLMEVNHA